MVIGHSGFPFSNWIYLFHMALFFVASGYLWDEKHSDSLAATWQYTKKKIRTLWLPYALGNSLFVLLSNTFVRVGIYSNKPLFLDIAGYDASLIQIMSIKQIAVEIVKSFLFFGGSQLGGALWFFRCMFIVNIVHCLLCWVLKKSKWYKPVMIVIFIITLGLAWYVSLGHWQFLRGFKTEFAAYAAYLIGVGLGSWKKYKETLKGDKVKIGTAAVSFIGLCVLSRFGTVSLANGRIVNPLFFALATSFGWLMLHSLVLLVEKNDFFVEMSKASVQIMTFHFLAFKLVSWIYLLISGKESVLLASFPVIVDVPGWLWIMYSIVGLLISYIIYRIWGVMKASLHKR